MKIKEAFIDDCGTIAMLVREANKEVAEQFGLDAENCPKHASFCSGDWIAADFERGVRYFIMEKDTRPVACVAYEKPEPGLSYLNRLAVLPADQKQGIGALLVDHIIQLAKEDALDTISIGVIGEHATLQQWYQKLGFVLGENKRFPHLPFSVTYMTYTLNSR